MNYINKTQLGIINRVRMLWMQHSEWTRMAFTSVIFGNPDEKAVIDRLLRNPMDFAYFLMNFYGDVIGRKFGDLLTEHLSLAVSLVKATVEGDTVKAEQINERLYYNADEISALLASINPYWCYESWRVMFYTHLDLAKKMATEKIDGDYRESINTYDRFEAEVMGMAEMMYQGILRQFLSKTHCFL